MRSHANHRVIGGGVKKRFYCHQISSAKQQSTRDKRLSSVLAQIG